MNATSLPRIGTSWERPTSFEEASRLLVEADGAGRLVAGCTVLSPLVLRTRPEIRCAIDLIEIDGAAAIERAGSRLRIGATATIGQLAADRAVAAGAPQLAEVARGIGDEVVRGMATCGGNVAARTPAAFELPTALAALGAELVTVTPEGERRVPAAAAGDPEPGLGPFDVLASIELEVAPGSRFAYRKLTTNASYYVVANLAICAPSSGPARAYAGLGGAVPQRLEAVESALASGGPFDSAEVAERACERLQARSDALASASYRVRALRALLAAELDGFRANGDGGP